MRDSSSVKFTSSVSLGPGCGGLDFRPWGFFPSSLWDCKASANLYSLVETAKANGLEPYRYLREVFTALPQAETVKDIESLLPWALKKTPAEHR